MLLTAGEPEKQTFAMHTGTKLLLLHFFNQSTYFGTNRKAHLWVHFFIFHCKTLTAIFTYLLTNKLDADTLQLYMLKGD